MTLEDKYYREKNSYTDVVITTGAATTLADQKGSINVFFKPTATLTAHAVTFPPNPVDGAQVEIFGLGTGLTGAVSVTSLTVVANTGQALAQPAQPGSFVYGKTVAYKYEATGKVWIRKY